MTWVEKHRPKKFEEIKGQDIALVNIKKISLKNFNLRKTKKKTKKSTSSPRFSWNRQDNNRTCGCKRN